MGQRVSVCVCVCVCVSVRAFVRVCGGGLRVIALVRVCGGVGGDGGEGEGDR